MPDVYSDRYWTQDFQVTHADLDRMADHIRETGQAHDLSILVQRLIRGRLRYGPDTSPPALPNWVADGSVRVWDPAGIWKVGDHAILYTWPGGRRRRQVIVGEIVRIDRQYAFFGIADDPASERQMQLASPGSPQALEWHQTVRDEVEVLRRGSNPEEQVDAVVLQRGDRVASQLLDALRADTRFVRLAGRWYLCELALAPSEQQILALAWAMLRLDEAQPTEAFVPLVQPPLVEGDRGLFGLYLALRDRPDLFANADPGQRPRWVLAGPPPGPFTPRQAAYDPQSYEVLCLPDQSASTEVVKRLWNLGLLPAVA